MEFDESEKIFGVRRPAVALLQQASRLSSAVTKRRQAVALQSWRFVFFHMLTQNEPSAGSP